ncbi:DUF2339 domain-containing protein [Leptothrix sp. BB-4]
MKPIWMVLLGALLGAVVNEGGSASAGAVFGALLAWLLSRQIAQGREIEALRERLTATPRIEPAPQVEETTVPAVIEPVVTEPAVIKPAVIAPVPLEPVPAKPVAPLPDDWLTSLPPALHAWLVSGNPILKIGIGVLFVGLAFLAKYASEHVTVPIELRLGGIALVALGLLATGWRLRTSRPVHAQVLQGGAVATLYLTIYAATRFFGLMPAGTAFIAMVAVAALAAGLALRQGASALAIIGALGGYATPLLLATDGGDARLLFGYYLVLDIGLVAVAWRLRSRALNLIGFFATFVIATVWGVLSFAPADRPWAQAFLIAYFLLFNAVARLTALSPHGRTSQAHPWRLDAPLVFGLSAITLVLQAGLVRDLSHGAAWSALVLGLFHLAQWRWLRRASASGPAVRALLAQADAAIGTVCLTLAIPLAFDASQTAGLWALEGAGAFWLGLRQQRRLTRAFGLLLMGLSGAALLHAIDDSPAPDTVLNALFLNALLVAAGAVVAAWLTSRREPGPAEPVVDAAIEPLLIGWATLWLLIAAGLQLHHVVPNDAKLGVALVALAGIAALWTTLGRWLAWPGAARVALTHAPVLGLLALVTWALHDDPRDAGGAWGWPVALAVQAGVLHLLSHLGLQRPATPGPASVPASIWQNLAAWTHRCSIATPALLGAALGHALTAPWGPGDSAWPWLGWGIAPLLMLVLLNLERADRCWPIRLDVKACRDEAGGVLALAVLLWTLMANGGSTGALSTGSAWATLPLLNPLDAAIGLALWASWRRLATRALPMQIGPLPLVGGAVFVWLNAMLLRAFHHHADVPYTLQAWVDTLAVQTGLTLLWSAIALALTWIASRRGERQTWQVGAVLLAIVMLKLLVVDLSGSGTVTRIVSFIGVGVLMLVIGFVAPLPAARAQVEP